jgi:hypothetical protein
MKVPTHSAIHSQSNSGLGANPLKLWLAEASVHGHHRQEMDGHQRSEELTGKCFAGTFAIAARQPPQFSRLANTGKNSAGDYRIVSAAWEVSRSSSSE